MKDIAPLDRNGEPLETRFGVRLPPRVSMLEIASIVDSDARSDHTREDIHKQGDIDEVSFQADISDITDPDLIASGDLKRL